MALPMMNFQQRSVDEDNPFLRGMERGQGLAQRGYQFPYEIEKIKQANIMARLQNQYYGPNIESEMGLRGAQQGLVGEQSKYYGPNMESDIGLRNAQTGLVDQQSKYYGQNMNSQIGQRNAQIDFLNRKQTGRMGQDGLTTSNRTANQGILQAIDNTIPIIQQLKQMNVPGQFVSKYFNAADQYKYQSQVSALTDSLVSAFNLPKTNESIHLVQQMTQKQTHEDDADYKARLDELIRDLNSRKRNAMNLLNGEGFGQESQDASSLSNEELIQILREGS